MKLEILVPQYREDEATIRPLLDSIALQQAADLDEVGVVIVNDGSDVRLGREFLAGYPYRIRYIPRPHGGVSAARNAALDAAEADYVMFCDADDMFGDVCGLYLILREIAAGFDMLVSDFTEEFRKDGETCFVTHERDSTFVHGKVFRREYLTERGIRFCDRLTVHEDSYFVVLASVLTDDLKYTTNNFYLWRWRDGSVCREDPDFLERTRDRLIDSNDALVGELLRRGLTDRAAEWTAYMILATYYAMQRPPKKSEKEYRAAAEKRIRAYIQKRRGLWEMVPEIDRARIAEGRRRRAVTEGMPMERETLEEWLRRMEREDAT